MPRRIANESHASNMILAPDEAALFYRAWWPLLTWINDQRRVVPPFPKPTAERPLHVTLAHPIRQVLWAEDALRERFLAEGAANLGSAERELIASWKHRVAGSFVVFKHLQKHSIFMSEDVFGVLGLYSPLSELVRAVPAYVEAVLLPFERRIIIDGIVSSPGVQLHFGAGMRRTFATQYAEARARSKVRTSLLPSATAQVSLPLPRAKSAPAGKARSSSILGAWRITKTELWDQEALDLIEEACLHFGKAHLGELAMIAMRAGIDYRLETRDGKQRVEFSFDGDDDGDPCSGRGWAMLDDDDVLRGRLYIHRGDESAFEAVRVQTGTRTRRRRGGGG